MSVDDVVMSDSDRQKPAYHFDRNAAEYRSQFKQITEEMHAKCPMAWTETYGGHWVAAGSNEVFELARCPAVSNDHDINNERRGYKGISIPTARRVSVVRGGILEMDEPEHRIYRNVLNPYMSPAAVKRWEPFIHDVTRACLDEKIEGGQHRLRRRPGKRRARRADAGDAGHSPEEVEPLQRAGARGAFTPRSTRPTSSGSPRCTGRWASTWSTTCSRFARIRGPAS